jgi:hypothetical protein
VAFTKQGKPRGYLKNQRPQQKVADAEVLSEEGHLFIAARTTTAIFFIPLIRMLWGRWLIATMFWLSLTWILWLLTLLLLRLHNISP